MKKNLEAELMSLAHRILQMKNRADVHELKGMAAILHEKLSVLSYVEKYFEGHQPTIGKKEVEESLSEFDHEQRYAPDGTLYNPEGITEPNTEKIKDIVAQMPPETENLDRVLENILPEDKESSKEEISKKRETSQTESNDESPDPKYLNELKVHGISYDDLPQFEPVKGTTSEKEEEKTEDSSRDAHRQNADIKNKPKSRNAQVGAKSEGQKLHQKLRKGISFGLNERVVFVKHLFAGKASDYDRVLSQLNTFSTFPEAKDFIENTVKPDYNWEDEEKYEKQFLNAVKDRME